MAEKRKADCNCATDYVTPRRNKIVRIDVDEDVSFATMASEADRSAEDHPTCGREDAFLNRILEKMDGANKLLSEKLNENVRQLIHPFNLQISENCLAIGNNARAIEEIRLTIRGITPSRGNSIPNAVATPDVSHKDQEQMNYEISRRSIRIWPVKGESDAEIKTNAEIFLLDVLLVARSDVEAAGKLRFRRTKTPKKARLHDEVLITFPDKFTRDQIAGHAKNLAKKVDDNGFPTAGLRMDYPGHLASDFRLLESYGKYLRRTRGEGLKRNMRFNDDNESIYMDVKLPKEEEWLRVTPPLAKDEMGRVDRKQNSDIRRRLAESSPSKPHPRQGLLRGRPPGSQPPMDPPRNRPSGWTRENDEDHNNE